MQKILNVIPSLLFLVILAGSDLNAQPEFRSDVQKEYDEHGNIIRFDSTWSWSYQNGEDPDSVFSRIFKDNFSEFSHRFSPAFPDSVFSFHFPEHLMNADHIREFMEQYSFPGFEDFFGEHPFPESEDHFHGWNFPDLEEFFGKFPDFGDLFEHFHEFSLPGDSIRPLKPDLQLHPGQQKKSARTIEI